MKRKVARIGPSTLMISLPSKWVKQHRIQKGHEIEIEERDKTLVVHPSTHAQKERTELHLHAKEQFLHRYLRSLYHRGVTEIAVTCEEELDFEDIKKKLDSFLGFEIIEQGKKSCIIRNVADTIEGEFDAVLRKIFLMDEMMAQESLEHIETGNYDALKNVAEAERTNNKLVNLSCRIIHKQRSLNTHTAETLALLGHLENIADSYRDICVYLRKERSPLSKEASGFYRRIGQHYKQLTKLYYSFHAEDLANARDARILLFQQGENLLERGHGRETIVLHHLLFILNQLKDIELLLGGHHP